MGVFAERVGKIGSWDSKFLLFERFLDVVTERATAELESRWIDRLAGVDVFTEDHVRTALHSASSDLRWHPHVHALASRGGWDRDGAWYPVPYVDEKAAELLFRQKVLSLLDRSGLLGVDRLELLDSWKSGHTGFSAHNRVTVAADDAGGLERLARCSPQPRFARSGSAAAPSAPAGPDLLRPALSLERLELDGAVARYRSPMATTWVGLILLSVNPRREYHQLEILEGCCHGVELDNRTSNRIAEGMAAAGL